MKLKHLITPAILFSVYSCQWGGKNPVKAGITKDTLAYQYQTIKQRADDCKSKSDSGCTVVTIKYPQFKNEPILNDSIRLRLIDSSTKQKPVNTSLAAVAPAFIAQYKKDLKGGMLLKGMHYTLDNKASVARQDSSLTTIQIDNYSFTGGAHGIGTTSFINWNSKQHKTLTLEDVLEPDYLPQLNKVAEKIFRKQENLTDTSSLARDYFFKDAKFSINSNYLLTPVGIRFLYNVYEIKPYAAGQTDLVVPYTQIKSLLKPHTVIAQYLQ